MKLKYLVIGLGSFALGFWFSYQEPKAGARVKVMSETYDLRNYDVLWQVQGEDKYIGLCRGPVIDHEYQTITCIMPKGTAAPWVRPMSESIEPDKEYAQARLDEFNLR